MKKRTTDSKSEKPVEDDDLEFPPEGGWKLVKRFFTDEEIEKLTENFACTRGKEGFTQEERRLLFKQLAAHKAHADWMNFWIDSAIEGRLPINWSEEKQDVIFMRGKMLEVMRPPTKTIH